MAKTAVTLKPDALLLLAWNTNVLEKRVTMEIFYEPVTLLRTLIQIGGLSHKTTIDYHLTLRCTKCSCQKSKLLTDDVLLIGSMEIFGLNDSIETTQADCSSCGERGQKHENIIRVQKNSLCTQAKNGISHRKKNMPERNVCRTVLGTGERKLRGDRRRYPSFYGERERNEQ